MWLLSELACLLLFLSVGNIHSILPCLEKLGRQKSAYRIESSNQTLLFTSHIPFDHNNQKICLTVLLDIADDKDQPIYCGKSISNSIEGVSIPQILQGLVPVQIDVYNITLTDRNSEESAVSHLAQSYKELYYVSSLSTFSSPSSSLLSRPSIPPSATIQIVSPSYGMVHSEYEFLLNFTPDLYTFNHVVEYEVEIKGLTNRTLQSTAVLINSYRVEPASWFIDIQPIFHISVSTTASTTTNANTNQAITDERNTMISTDDNPNNNTSVSIASANQRIHGYAGKAYVEFVLSDEDILKERIFADDWKKTEKQQQSEEYISRSKEYGEGDRDVGYNSKESFDQNSDNINASVWDSSHSHKDTSFTHKERSRNSDNFHNNLTAAITTMVDKNSTNTEAQVNICIWGSNKMDGQKSIWLQQIQHLNVATDSSNSSQGDFHSRFSFTWILTTDLHNDKPGTVRHRLQQLQFLYKQQQQLDEYEITDAEATKASSTSYINSDTYHSTATAAITTSSSLAYVNVVKTPLDNKPILIDDLREDPLDGTLPLSELWNNDVGYLYQYTSKRLRANHYNITSLHPMWAQRLYQIIRDNMIKHKCDVVVYGNDRGFTADVLIRDTAIALGIPTAVELLNLFIDKDMLPTVLIAPSHYALQHESIQTAVMMGQTGNTSGSNSSSSSSVTTPTESSDDIHISMEANSVIKSESRFSDTATSPSSTSPLPSLSVQVTRVVVISPGVDLVTFNRTNLVCPHTGRRVSNSATTTDIVNRIHGIYDGNENPVDNKDEFNCYDDKINTTDNHYDHAEKDGINIGFIARLAPEKSPGLFLQMAAVLVERYLDHSQQIRFTIVGDGPLRQSLQELTERLNISNAVRFAGWVDASQSKLPRVIADMDIVVNPSLRGWSETFCIANIEVMAMAVPLVTFGVGGVGEYVDNDSEPSYQKHQQHCDSVSKDSNADNHDDPDIFLVVNDKNQVNSNHSSEKNKHCSINNRSTSQPQSHDHQHHFTVTSNAVLVNTATPLALADAVDHLILHKSVRLQLGRAGSETVKAYFTMERQMKQYRALYTQLARDSHQNRNGRIE